MDRQERPETHKLASLMELVVSTSMPSALLKRVLADFALLARRRRRLSVAPSMRQSSKFLKASWPMGGRRTQSPPIRARQRLVPPTAERPMSKLSPFYGLGLKEACPKLLSLIGSKTPQTPREIWDSLKAEGWTSAHSDPVHAVNDALRRRAKTHGDVLLVGAGKWGRIEWYTEAELEEIRKSVGGMGGRDRGDHIENTKAGMITARQRGARLGAVKKLSAEQADQIPGFGSRWHYGGQDRQAVRDLHGVGQQLCEGKGTRCGN